MNLPALTVREVMRLGPCDTNYPRARVKELWAGRSALDVLDVLALDIPAADRLWAVLHPEFWPEGEADVHELACRFASRALRQERKRGREPDARSWRAIRVKRRWLRGAATDDELAAARAAAWAAIIDASRAAARAAIIDASREAAWAAYGGSAGGSAEAAAWAAAGDTETDWQIACCRRYAQSKAVSS